MGIEVKNRHGYKGRGIYVGRPSVLGNPYVLKREAAIAVHLRPFGSSGVPIRNHETQEWRGSRIRRGRVHRPKYP